MSWVDCQFMRYLGQRECVVRLVSTGAIISLKLREPLDTPQACLLCATNPAPCRVLLGPLANQTFTDCEMELARPMIYKSMPPPLRFQRGKLTPSSRKRRKTDS